MNIARTAAATLIGLATALTPTSGASADVLATATLATNYTQPVTTSSWTAVFTTLTTTALQFKTTKLNQKIIITYNAECNAFNFTVYARMKIDSGLIADPNSSDKLCFTALSSSFTPTTRIAVATIAAKGLHTVSVELLGSTNASILIGNSVLMVQS